MTLAKRIARLEAKVEPPFEPFEIIWCAVGADGAVSARYRQRPGGVLETLPASSDLSASRKECGAA